MAKSVDKNAFMAVLEYILNDAGMREIDALEAAVERRRKDLSAQTGIISLDPERAAREMSGAVQNSVDNSMDSIRKTFRQFACDLIRKEAPELTEAQMAELVDTWMPAGNPAASSSSSGSNQAGGNASGSSGYRGLARKGLVNGVPPSAMYEMIMQFVAYSTGRMAISDESALRDAVGDWTSIYWKKFPQEIQAVIRDLLNEKLTQGEFEAILETLLH